MAEGITFSSLLRIDEAGTLEGIKTYLRKTLHKQSASAVLLGLSGGIDSCLLAAIAVEALGEHSVRAAYLYDQHSGQELHGNARLVSDWLGIELAEKSIEPVMRERGVYSSPHMRIASFSGSLNRLLHQVFRLVHGESLFISSLRMGGTQTAGEDARNPDFQRTGGPIEGGFNSRHIYRRRFLEAEAKKRNCLLLGAANRTEWLIGWFVKGGVDDLPNQPLIGLYKTQIKQLASFLRIPTEVLAAKPSPDMLKGITDEFAFGASYNAIDAVLDFLDGGVTKEEIMRAGVTEKEICQVVKMKRLSAWKRSSPHAPPPVDGGPSGGLRLAHE